MFETMYLKTTNADLENVLKDGNIVPVQLSNGSGSMIRMAVFEHGFVEFMGHAENFNFASYRFPCDQTDEQWMSSILGGDLI